MLEQLANSKQLNAALIKGDPGMGKTFLMKKIACDWVQQYQLPEVCAQFKLILTVPLKSVEVSQIGGKVSSTYLELALEFWLLTLNLSKKVNQSSLMEQISQLGNKLLIFFDGLDE